MSRELNTAVLHEGLQQQQEPQEEDEPRETKISSPIANKNNELGDSGDFLLLMPNNNNNNNRLGRGRSPSPQEEQDVSSEDDGSTGEEEGSPPTGERSKWKALYANGRSTLLGQFYNLYRGRKFPLHFIVHVMRGVCEGFVCVCVGVALL